MSQGMDIVEQRAKVMNWETYYIYDFVYEKRNLIESFDYESGRSRKKK